MDDKKKGMVSVYVLMLYVSAVINDSKNKLKFVDYLSDNDLLAKNNVCIMMPEQANIEC